MKITPILVLLCTIFSSLASEEKASSKWYFHIQYPTHFKVDPLSHQGERKWWAKYDDPESELSISTDSWGDISQWDLLETIPGGWDGDIGGVYKSGKSIEQVIEDEAKSKTIKSYFLSEILPQNTEKKEFPYYIRYISKNDSSVKIYYFNKSESDAISGHCYETLSFNFAKGNYSKHKKVISEVIESAQPWLSSNNAVGAVPTQ